MRKSFVFTICLFPFACFGQDIIVKKNSETIASKVIEITQSEIKYKPFKDSLSPLRVVPIYEVLVIYYQNGTRETFGNVITSPIEKPQPSNPQEYRNGLKLGDIVMYKGKESGKYRRGRIIAFTANGAIITNMGEKMELRLDELSKFFDRPKEQKEK
jgi:hypothetical protein